MSDRTDDGTRLSVGQLAAAAGMTTKALRHYDRVGLFRPDEVDADTGYRWYRAERVPQARLVAALRGVGVPLDEVAQCLPDSGDSGDSGDTGDGQAAAVVDDVLARHRQRLEARLTRVRGDLHRLSHLQADGLPADAVPVPPGLPDGAPMAAPSPQVLDERQLAADLFNGVWTLLETEERTQAQDDRMLHSAHASRYHWGQVGGPQQLARGEWLCSRVYTVLARPEPALHHARRVLDLCEEHAIADWDLAFAHEALARAHAVAGDPDAAAAAVRAALRAADDIADPADRDLLLDDLATVPSLPADGP
jgi:DNA-binding transcriptional MerR regulator